jgi:UDP-N-acetylmuramoylalanine--D-glutamate ligase
MSMGALAGRRVAVVGLGAVSGVAAVKTLSRHGAIVVVNDARTESELGASLRALRDDPSVRVAEYIFGGHPSELAQRVDLVVLSPGVPYDLPLLAAARERDVPTIGELELAYGLSRSSWIAVTGTKGKSTTTTLIGQMLNAGRGGRRVCVAGNIGVALSLAVEDLTERDIVVAEVSSFQLESIVHFRPRVAVVLNVSPDHLDRHATMAQYIAAKQRILENQTEDDVVVLNQDDPVAREFATTARAHVWGFSLARDVAEGAFLRGGRLVWAHAGRETVVTTATDIGVPGRHNVANALASIAVCGPMGVSPEAMAGVLREFRGLPHAYESVLRVRDVHYINDSKATNVAATRAALDVTPRPVLLIMGGVDKGNTYDELLAVVREKVSRLILLGPHTARLEAAFRDVVPLVRADSMEAAVRLAAAAAVPGATVLLSPGHASFDLFADWKDRGDAFRQAVRSLAR